MFRDQIRFLLKIKCLLLLMALGSTHLLSQDASEVGSQVDVILLDGNRIKGELISVTDLTVVIYVKDLKEFSILRNRIKEWNPKDPDISRDPISEEMDYYNATNYLVNASGYTLKKGQSYYQNIGVFFNAYSVGLSDRFSLTGGVELISPLFASRLPSLYISPKYSIPFGNDKGAFSIGGTGLLNFSNDDPFVLGLAQASVTFGDRNNNFTIGSGIGFSIEDVSGGSTIPFNLSGMVRISRRISLVTDNFVIAYDDFDGVTGLFSFAVRLHFENQAALNLGLWRYSEDWGSDVLALPFISLTLPIK